MEEATSAGSPSTHRHTASGEGGGGGEGEGGREGLVAVRALNQLNQAVLATCKQIVKVNMPPSFQMFT